MLTFNPPLILIHSDNPSTITSPTPMCTQHSPLYSHDCLLTAMHSCLPPLLHTLACHPCLPLLLATLASHPCLPPFFASLVCHPCFTPLLATLACHPCFTPSLHTLACHPCLRLPVHLRFHSWNEEWSICLPNTCSSSLQVSRRSIPRPSYIRIKMRWICVLSWRGRHWLSTKVMTDHPPSLSLTHEYILVPLYPCLSLAQHPINHSAGM